MQMIRYMVHCLCLSLMASVCISAPAATNRFLEEDLSRSFDSIELVNTNGSLLVLRTLSFMKGPLFVSVGESAPFVRTAPGSRIVLRADVKLRYYRSRPPWSEITLLPDAGRLGDGGPWNDLRGERQRVLFKTGQRELLVAPALGMGVDSTSHEQFEFSFPFKPIWADEAEMYDWMSGRPYRGRTAGVEADAVRVRAQVEDLGRRVASSLVAKGMRCESPDGCWTNIVVDIIGESGDQGRMPYDVVMAGVAVTNCTPSLRGLRLEAAVPGGEVLSCRLSKTGRVQWLFIRKKGLDPEHEKQMTEFRAYEFDDSGRLTRAFCPGENPLLIVTSRTSYWSGNAQRQREFLSDLLKAIAPVW